MLSLLILFTRLAFCVLILSVVRIRQCFVLIFIEVQHHIGGIFVITKVLAPLDAGLFKLQVTIEPLGTLVGYPNFQADRLIVQLARLLDHDSQ